MNEAAATTPRGEAPGHLLVERRAWVRYGTHLDVSCQTTGARTATGWPGTVCNLCVGGVGLLLKHRFRPGTMLAIELPSREQPLQARVIHARSVLAYGAQCWLHGCELTTQLTEKEVQALRKRS